MWQLPERAPRPQPLPHVMQPFDATSAYHDSYPAHELQPRWRRQPELYKGEQGSLSEMHVLGVGPSALFSKA